jgi:hypothetical protein
MNADGEVEVRAGGDTGRAYVPNESPEANDPLTSAKSRTFIKVLIESHNAPAVLDAEIVASDRVVAALEYTARTNRENLGAAWRGNVQSTMTTLETVVTRSYATCPSRRATVKGTTVKVGHCCFSLVRADIAESESASGCVTGGASAGLTLDGRADGQILVDANDISSSFGCSGAALDLCVEGTVDCNTNAVVGLRRGGKSLVVLNFPNSRDRNSRDPGGE